MESDKKPQLDPKYASWEEAAIDYYDQVLKAERFAKKFAHHRMDCHCFICRNLTEEEQDYKAVLNL